MEDIQVTSPVSGRDQDGERHTVAVGSGVRIHTRYLRCDTCHEQW